MFPHLREARGFVERFRGLMLERDPSRCYLFIPRCRSVHTFFMRLAIDVVFIDDASRIVAVREAVKPWRLVFGPSTARATLELPAGVARANSASVGGEFR